jgi:hypothetical protein
MNRLHVIVFATSVCLLSAALPARADNFVAPSIGVSFGGDSGTTLVDATHDSSRLAVGVAGGTMFNGLIGLEEDFTWFPDFFGNGGNINSSRVVTLMSNVIVGIPIGGEHGGGVRPFATAGLGWIQRDISASLPTSSFRSNDIGYDLGVGVMGYFADHVGVRGEVQYFRNFEHTGANVIGLDAGGFNFFKGSFGVLVRF